MARPKTSHDETSATHFLKSDDDALPPHFPKQKGLQTNCFATSTGTITGLEMLNQSNPS